jgi:hypothetical protein
MHWPHSLCNDWFAYYSSTVAFSRADAVLPSSMGNTGVLPGTSIGDWCWFASQPSRAHNLRLSAIGAHSSLRALFDLDEWNVLAVQIEPHDDSIRSVRQVASELGRSSRQRVLVRGIAHRVVWTSLFAEGGVVLYVALLRRSVRV